MISHSTRIKRRRQACNPALKTLRIHLIEPRCDFWLVSHAAINFISNKVVPSVYNHKEIYGQEEIRKVYARIRQRLIHSGATL